MNSIHKSLRGIVLLFTLLLFSACASKEINNLNQSVSNLEQKLSQYQQLTSRDTAETTTRVNEVNQSINNAFRDIRFTQSNLESSIDQLSSRLSQVERDVATLLQSTKRLDSFSTESYSTLTDRISTSEDAFQKQRKQDLELIQKNLDSLSSEIATVRSDLKRTSNEQNRLERQMASLSEENRKIYRQILKELGASIPGDADLSSVRAEDSGKVHIVQKGETLGKIAVKYGVSVKSFQKLNQIEDASKIQIGQKLRIPK